MKTAQTLCDRNAMTIMMAVLALAALDPIILFALNIGHLI